MADIRIPFGIAAIPRAPRAGDAAEAVFYRAHPERLSLPVSFRQAVAGRLGRGDRTGSAGRYFGL